MEVMLEICTYGTQTRQCKVYKVTDLKHVLSGRSRYLSTYLLGSKFIQHFDSLPRAQIDCNALPCPK